MGIKTNNGRPEGCICELYSDISLNMEDMRSRFGYKMLYDIPPRSLIKNLKSINFIKVVDDGRY